MSMPGPAAPLPTHSAVVPISGRYVGQHDDWELELRIDCDGPTPLGAVSGDLFKLGGERENWEGSFILQLDEHADVATTGEAVLRGMARSTFPGIGQLEVTIRVPRVVAPLQPADAQVRFTHLLGFWDVRFSCTFKSVSFRRVELEIDYVTNVKPFRSYFTGAAKLRAGKDRTLDVPAAFKEAGVEVVLAEASDAVDAKKEAGHGEVWSNAELHAAMENHFSHFKEHEGRQAWRVWLLAATIHENNLRGVMFDAVGPPNTPRQGCAVFHGELGSLVPGMRDQLFTYVHELGHCFNLCHCFEPDDKTPQHLRRADALTWMNYPWQYSAGPGKVGENAFWRAFPFAFDANDLLHLRHGFFREVVMGGDPFRGQPEIDPALFVDPVTDRSGLSLRLRTARTYFLGEPVVVQLKLANDTLQPRWVNARIHPNEGLVHVAIRKPGGAMVIYRPFVRECIVPDLRWLDDDAPAVYERAYVGHGKDGLYFDHPGTYHLRAIYQDLDGSRVVSNVARLHVQSPVDAQENHLADLYLGEEQGRLFSFQGSESEFLRDGNDNLEEAIERYSHHPLAVYAKLAKGTSRSRPFKVIDGRQRRVRLISPDLPNAIRLLSDVVETTIAANPVADPMADVGVDNITLSESMERLAWAHLDRGDAEKAEEIAERIKAHFDQPSIPVFVRQTLNSRAQRIVARQGDEDGPRRERRRRGRH